MNATQPLHLFQGYGVELEYMIVERDTLNVAPLAAEILQAQAGVLQNEIEVGPLCWSNELVLHVVELKTNGPAKTLKGLADEFQGSLRQIDRHLAPLGATLMPGAMHPWMNPLNESRLWPHGDSSIYQAYNRIFGCQGHGWSNLQSTHLNLPFCGDEEFGRLHAAIRLVLPLLPALAASSPIVGGRPTGLLDYRLRAYQQNQRKIPVITGTMVPEPVFSRADYEQQILRPIYAAISPHDPDGLLQHEWLNSRGAIARFDRDTIEVRLLDVQECPHADLAIIALLCEVVKALVAERWSSYEEQCSWGMEALAKLLSAAIGDAERTRIDNLEYLRLFGCRGKRTSIGELCQHLAETLCPELLVKDGPLRVILERGPLARRILQSSGQSPTRRQLFFVYGQLCECLAEGEMFHA